MDSKSLFEKLKSMGVQLGASNLSSLPKKRDVHFNIENVVEGFNQSTIHGQAFITVKNYPADYQHGNRFICEEQKMDVLAAWSQVPQVMQSGGQNIVFLDTETSGLSGGTGTYAFLIGIGYRTDAGFELVQFFMRDPEEELALFRHWING